LLLTLVALLACWIPARRATRVISRVRRCASRVSDNERNQRMPDWKAEIRQRLAGLKLEHRRAKAAIVEELAQHLDDCYAGVALQAV